MSERITVDPLVCHGKPVIRGTRVPVSIVLGSLAGGMSMRELEEEYALAESDIRAAIAYAVELPLT